MGDESPKPPIQRSQDGMMAASSFEIVSKSSGSTGLSDFLSSNIRRKQSNAIAGRFTVLDLPFLGVPTDNSPVCNCTKLRLTDRTPVSMSRSRHSGSNISERLNPVSKATSNREIIYWPSPLPAELEPHPSRMCGLGNAAAWAVLPPPPRSVLGFPSEHPTGGPEKSLGGNARRSGQTIPGADNRTRKIEYSMLSTYGG